MRQKWRHRGDIANREEDEETSKSFAHKMLLLLVGIVDRH